MVGRLLFNVRGIFSLLLLHAPRRTDCGSRIQAIISGLEKAESKIFFSKMIDRIEYLNRPDSAENEGIIPDGGIISFGKFIGLKQHGQNGVLGCGIGWETLGEILAEFVVGQLQRGI